MSAREMTAEGARRLKGSFAAGASLAFAALLSYAAFLLAGRLATAFFDTLLLQQGGGLSPTSLAGVLTTLFLCLALLSPFQLNVKRWYQGLDGGYHPPRGAFTYFTSPGRYLSALWFSLMRYAAVFLTFLVPQLPSIVLAAVVKVSLENSETALGPIYAVFIVLCALLAVLALAFSLYAAMGFFLADYLYVMEEERNPFKALAASWRLMRARRAGLLRLLLRLSPYYLLFLPLATIPFAAPNILSALAVYARQQIRPEGESA